MDLEHHVALSIFPSRSRYQLRQFVVGQHDTAPMQWRQVMLEAKALITSMRLTELEIQKNAIEMTQLAESDDPVDAIELQKRIIGLEGFRESLETQRLELSWLEEIADEIGPYTFEEIEVDQPEYWALRLNRQASMDQLGTQLGVNPGNLTSMLQAGLITRSDAPEIGRAQRHGLAS